MELQRYSMMRDPARLDEDWQGQWVQHSDAAAQLAAKDAEIEALKQERDDARHAFTSTDRDYAESIFRVADLTRRLALAVAEVQMARTWVADQKTHDGAVFATYGEYSPEYMAARAATDADPVLRAMIEKGSA